MKFAAILIWSSAIFLSAKAFAIYPDVRAPDFPWVGKVNGDGSGTAIGSHFVITARHVRGTTFTLEGYGTFVASKRFDCPQHDIALLYFPDRLPGYNRILFDEELGQTVTIVGYGLTGRLRADGSGYEFGGPYGVRRKTMQVIGRHVGGNLLHDLDGNGIDTFGDGGPIEDEGGCMAGDSGGGWFREIGGEYFLVGVTWESLDMNFNNRFDDFGDGDGAVDLKTYKSWILNVFKSVGLSLDVAVGR